MIIGASFSVLIILKTFDPQSFWGNDVFNAAAYRYGFWVANTYLVLTWVVIYPFIFFYTIHMSISLFVILRNLRQRSLFRINVFHKDNCGGMSKFGTLNLLIMMIYLSPLSAMLALWWTHESGYLTLSIPALGLSLIIIVQSSIGISAITKVTRRKVSDALLLLSNELDKGIENLQGTESMAVPILLWNHIRSIHTVPYTRNIGRFVTFVRYVPVTLSLGQMIASLD